MRFRGIWRFIAGIAFLLLIVSGCVQTAPADQTPTAGGAVTPTPIAGADTTPTIVPTQPAASPTLEASPSPEATPTEIVASPTPEASPTPQATATPAASPTAQVEAALPPDAIWILSSGRIIALAPDTPVLEMPAQFQRSGIARVAVAPGGSRLAYAQDAQVIVIDATTGESHVVASGNEVAIEPHFAPDGARLAFSMVSLESWELRVLDLESGEEQVLQQGSRNRAQIPVDWTPAGLFVQGIIWASDAPPQNLALLQPDGTQQILRQESYLRAVPSREGERVAIVTGQIPIGGPAARMAISVLDVSTGNEQVIFPETPIWISDIAWSPDGSQLAFISAPNPMAPVDTLHIISADGSDEQQVTTDTLGIAGEVRDIDWQGQNLLLLVAGDDGQLHLYQAAADDLSQAGTQELAAVEGDTGRGQVNRILYVPQ